ncbi:hypothetical protein BU26DRAFT_2935 [Trematosphaeria pertusa]|uniref:Uncharacterized protein n=1 Tax=Trematosphaeria pertusa TaxID=390896 RepID=A0A6A6IYE4_9PLEO|nr:uncharacterized protein BU26DRAFT_2935 [Trematosphaeria pertusa]KAF2255565.1 hypothetical protein BU26DRAFT_2935 [Trematosphaeria pertusa]
MGSTLAPGAEEPKILELHKNFSHFLTLASDTLQPPESMGAVFGLISRIFRFFCNLLVALFAFLFSRKQQRGKPAAIPPEHTESSSIDSMDPIDGGPPADQSTASGTDIEYVQASFTSDSRPESPSVLHIEYVPGSGPRPESPSVVHIEYVPGSQLDPRPESPSVLHIEYVPGSGPRPESPSVLHIEYAPGPQSSHPRSESPSVLHIEDIAAQDQEPLLQPHIYTPPQHLAYPPPSTATSNTSIPWTADIEDIPPLMLDEPPSLTSPHTSSSGSISTTQPTPAPPRPRPSLLRAQTSAARPPAPLLRRRNDVTPRRRSQLPLGSLTPDHELPSFSRILGGTAPSHALSEQTHREAEDQDLRPADNAAKGKQSMRAREDEYEEVVYLDGFVLDPGSSKYAQRIRGAPTGYWFWERRALVRKGEW